MNKKFYFGLALTAGLFASCSSEDLAGESASKQLIDDGAPAKIEIGLTPGYEITRGTGRVGDVAGASNAQWAGQKFTVLMLEKGTMLGAYATNDRNPGEELLKGQDMTADGVTVVSLADDAVYYPTADLQGNPKVYDFWAYRLDNSETDGAATPAATPGVPTFNGYDDANGTKITIPFAINGTQDIMVAATTPSDATYASNHPDLIYSAKSARNGVKPNLSFKHLLTSLTFKVKPKSRDISDQADCPITGGNAASFVPGYQITNITLKSMSTGELVAAYTATDEPERIEWTAAQDWADPTTLTAFNLMCRNRLVADKADIKMVAVSSNASMTINYDSGYEDAESHTSYTPDANLLTMEVYDSDAKDDATGLPTGNKTTLNAILNGGAGPVTGYIRTHKIGNRSPYQTSQSYDDCDYQAAEAAVTTDLVPFADNCDVAANKVVLDWEGYSPGTPATYQATDATATVADETAYDALAPADKAGKGDAAALTAATIAANEGKYFFNTDDNKAYKIEEAAAAVPGTDGTAQVSTVGAPMLVAPSNDAANSGYLVTVTYKYWKKQTASQVVLTTKTTDPFVVNNYTINGGAKVKGPFEAGKNYNVTITLYSDGETLSGDATSEPWVAGDDLNANDEE